MYTWFFVVFSLIILKTSSSWTNGHVMFADPNALGMPGIMYWYTVVFCAYWVPSARPVTVAVISSFDAISFLSKETDTALALATSRQTRSAPMHRL